MGNQKLNRIETSSTMNNSTWTPFKLPRFAKPSPLIAAVCALCIFSSTASLKADDAAPASRTHALLNLEFSDHYLTPRGMNVQNSGLVFQPLVLGLFNLYSGDSFVNNVTMVAGVWNCFGT